jgi:hypothetical protein
MTATVADGHADPEAVIAALREGIEGGLGRHDEVPTKWVLISETVGIDGERGLWLATSEGAKPWDIMGLLQWALAQEQAGAMREVLGGS